MKQELDEFTRAYIECALWSSNDESDESTGGEPLDKNYSADDIAPECLAQMVADCKAFQAEFTDELAAYNHPKYSSDELGGHDFWLSRNLHGAGFFDRTDCLPKAICDSLQAAVGWRTKYPEVDLYVGDDGLIHC